MTTTTQKPYAHDDTEVREMADKVVASLPDYLLRTNAWFGEFAVACRPDLSVDGLDETRDRAEISRRLDAQIEFAEKIVRAIEPILRALKPAMIDAGIKLAQNVTPTEASAR